MKIRTNGKIFIALSSFAEKDLVKNAGFMWHPEPANCRSAKAGKPCAACEAKVSKFWWTDDLFKAWNLRQYADPTQKEEFSRVFADLNASLDTSRSATSTAEFPRPAGFEYLGYQKAGIEFALKRRATLIGDEMGLGKTVQAIGVINASLPKRVLIICPKSLRLNWEKELRAWLVEPYGINAKHGAVSDSERNIWIATFEDVRKHTAGTTGDERLYTGPFFMFDSWDLIICDEAQALKNPKADITKKVVGYTAKNPDTDKYEFKPGIEATGKRVLFLSGTPLMNAPVELQPIAQVCDKQFMGFGFLKRYCGARQERAGSKLVWKFDGASNLSELQERMRASFMVRRLKADVLTELPAKTRKLVFLEPSSEATNLISQERTRLEEMGFSYGDETFALSPEMAGFDEIARVRVELGKAKIEPALAYIHTLMESVEKVIVFCHHKEVAYAMLDGLSQYGAVIITGDVGEAPRHSAVEWFQGSKETRVFIGTIAAAGVGLTLTASSNVVMVEQPWRPGDVIQAEDRAHRIGQKDAVLCHHLVFDGSYDVHMVQTIARKKNIAEQALDRPVEKEIVVINEPVKPAKKDAPAMADEEKAKLLADLVYLASRCDGAVDEDGVGFSALDSRIGKSLAAQARLTDAQAALAKRMLVKYRNTQLMGRE